MCVCVWVSVRVHVCVLHMGKCILRNEGKKKLGRERAFKGRSLKGRTAREDRRAMVFPSKNRHINIKEEKRGKLKLLGKQDRSLILPYLTALIIKIFIL